MRVRGLTLLALLLIIAAAASSCGPSDTSSSTTGTPVAVAPTSPLQPTVIPSVTPIGAPASNAAVYGSVQSSAASSAQTSSGAGAPLLYSAQSSSDTTTQQPNTTPVPQSVTLGAPTAAATPVGVVSIPPISDEGAIFNIINTLCIPLVNFLLNATIGVVVWAWSTVGAQGGLPMQILLCILLPLGGGWFLLFLRRRRRR